MKSRSGHEEMVFALGVTWWASTAGLNAPGAFLFFNLILMREEAGREDCKALWILLAGTEEDND